jgi:hypothetical protein
MTAKIIPFPSQDRVLLVPVGADAGSLPPAVRKLLAIIEATERALGSNRAPKGLSMQQYLTAIAPYLK